MSAQVVMPTKLRVGAGVVNNAGPKPTSSATSSKSPSLNRKPISTNTNRFNQRFKPPRKPEIQVNKQELKQKLTPLQYKVTQEKFTERAFSGEYVKLNDKGIYCCVVCGEELFSSETKYDSGCGWPAFFGAIDGEKLIQQIDLSHVGGNLLLLALNQDLARTEVICAKCGAHLGHVFDDGPKPTGKRYCVNSASLKFKKSDGKEVVCDIPTNGSCCFRSPTKPDASTIETNQDKTLKEVKNTVTTTKLDITGPKPLPLPPPTFQSKCRLESNPIIKETRQLKTKSLSPSRRNEINTTTSATTPTPTYSSNHARKVQMNKEDFFMKSSSPTASNRIKNYENSGTNNNKSLNNYGSNSTNTPSLSSSSSLSPHTQNTNNKPVFNRIKRISGTFQSNNGENGSDDHYDVPATSSLSFKSDLNNNKTTAAHNKYSDVKSRYLDHLDSLAKKSVIKHTFPGIKKSSLLSSSSSPSSSAINNPMANDTTTGTAINSLLESEL